MRRLTHQGWYNYVKTRSSTEGEDALTLEEDMLLCLHHIQNYLHTMSGEVANSRLANEHVEGMVGALDVAMEQIARNVGIEYPSSAAVRHALDLKRDQDREQLKLQGSKNGTV